MKLNVIAIALTTILFSCSQNKNTQNVTLEDEIDSTSFAIGVSVGENLNNQFGQDKLVNRSFVHRIMIRTDHKIYPMLQD